MAKQYTPNPVGNMTGGSPRQQDIYAEWATSGGNFGQTAGLGTAKGNRLPSTSSAQPEGPRSFRIKKGR